MLFQSSLSEELWTNVQARYQNGDYTGAILDAFVFLSGVIRDKSDLGGDGVDLVNKAFSESSPKIKINRMETQSEVDEQKGIANTLRGLYQFVRNPRSHEKFEDTEDTCNSILLFLDFVIIKIKGSTGQFEIAVFIEQVSDKRFVKSGEYCDTLVAEIPNRKFFETVLGLYKARESIEIYNLQAIFKSLTKRMNPTQRKSLVKAVSDDLRKTSNDNDIKCAVKILGPELWNELDPIAKIRTENRIIESAKESHFLCTWCTEVFGLIKERSSLLTAIGTGVKSGKSKDVDFFYKHLVRAAIPLIQKDDIETEGIENEGFLLFPSFLVTVRERIIGGSAVDYRGVKDLYVWMPDYLKRFFERALVEFKETEEEFDPKVYEDEIPF